MKLEDLLAKNHLASMKNMDATNEELENALCEIAQNQADIEDALVELASMIEEVVNNG